MSDFFSLCPRVFDDGEAMARLNGCYNYEGRYYYVRKIHTIGD